MVVVAEGQSRLAAPFAHLVEGLGGGLVAGEGIEVAHTGADQEARPGLPEEVDMPADLGLVGAVGVADVQSAQRQSGVGEPRQKYLRRQ